MPAGTACHGGDRCRACLAALVRACNGFPCHFNSLDGNRCAVGTRYCPVDVHTCARRNLWRRGAFSSETKEAAMRWWIAVALPFRVVAGEVPNPTLPIEIGVLSCTLGRAIDTPASDPSSAASEAREMLCSFKPGHNGPEEAYVGALKSINAAGPLPAKATLLWTVRAPVGTQLAPALLQQSYAADSATPAGQIAPLVGEKRSEITLHVMSDNEEGSASKEKPKTP